MMSKLNLVGELAKDMYHTCCKKLQSWTEILAVENEVMKLSNKTFLDAFKQVAHEISEITGIPYMTYLNKAKEMICQGVGMQDTMYYFDSVWYDLKFGKSQKGGAE